MGGKTLVKNTLVFGIILLFIVSAVSPMVIGLKSDTVDIEREEFLDNLAFYCYDASGSNAKYEHYMEYFQRDNSEIADLEEITIPVDLPQTSVSSGPMDSAWPMFCYDKKNTGKSPYNSSGNTLYEKWRIKLDTKVPFSSPVIDNNGTIYIGTYYGTLFAINSNGTEKWRYETDDWNSEMTTPALAADGTIYVASKNSNIYALSPDGTEKWRTSLQWHIHSSPVIADDGTIFIGGDEKFYALLPNGSILWENTTGDNIKASPAIGEDGTVYVASHDGYLYSFHPTNGTLKWKLKVSGGISCYSSPAIDENGIIYYGTRYDFYAINPNGTIKWKNEGGGCYYGGPVIDGIGAIYVKGGDKLHAYNSDGSVKWRFTIWTDYSAPAIANNGNIYIT